MNDTKPRTKILDEIDNLVTKNNKICQLEDLLEINPGKIFYGYFWSFLY